ncbi:hypothetical protein JAAARDRAFT_199150 [Jaapia argillacea MUCL 33604]|uniref:CHAT domain-containing protein n=1 Tax=Jaapia argillacea MUCL 33604 TaxID=933084 RepID=A0A067P8S7_9AGAM|nr:hypothetical protein JAAARDRAFT_199150 [Jaapia argillacea MUCL 33604]
MAPNDAPRPPNQHRHSGDSRGGISEYDSERSMLCDRLYDPDEKKDSVGIIEPGGKALRQLSVSASLEQAQPFDAPNLLQPSIADTDTAFKKRRDPSDGTDDGEKTRGDSFTIYDEGGVTVEDFPRELGMDSEEPIDREKIVPLPIGDSVPHGPATIVKDSKVVPYPDNLGHMLFSFFWRLLTRIPLLLWLWLCGNPVPSKKAGNMEEAMEVESKAGDHQPLLLPGLEKDCDPSSVSLHLTMPPPSPCIFDSTGIPPSTAEQPTEINRDISPEGITSSLLKSAEEFGQLIESDRKLLALLPDEDPARVDALLRSSRHLEHRFRFSDDMEDIQESITHARHALAACPAGHPLRPSCLRNLANRHCTRFRKSRQIDDLVDAIKYHRDDLSLCPVGHPERADCLKGLADALTMQQQHSGSGDEFEEIIEYRLEILALPPISPLGQSPDRHNLLSALHSRLDISGNLEELVNFTHVNLDLLPNQPGGDTIPRRDKSVAYRYQSRTLYERFLLSGNQQKLLEHAIKCDRKALDLRPEGDPRRDEVLYDLSHHLRESYQLCGRKEDLEESISCAQEALVLRPAGHHERVSTLTTLAIALDSRYTASPDQSGDLEEAIGLHREALNLRPVGDPERKTSLTHLAKAFETRYDHSGSMNDLESAIKYKSQCVACPLRDQLDSTVNRRGLAFEYNYQARRLYDRFTDRGEMRDLEHAIECDRQALDLRPDGEPGRDEVLFDLNRHLTKHFTLSRRHDYLDESIAHGRAALALRPSNHVHHHSTLRNLVRSLQLRWGTSSSRPGDLEEAIEILREDLNFPSIDTLDRLQALLNLSSLFRRRCRHSGSMNDLEEGIKICTEALTLCSPGHTLRPATLDHLSSYLARRFNSGIGQLRDLEEAIRCSQEALDITPSVSRKDREAICNGLASRLWTRYRHSGQLEHLEDSIKYYRVCLRLLPEGDDKRARVLGNLSGALGSRFQHSGQTGDLKEMVGHAREALSLRPAGHSRRSISLNALAYALEKYEGQLGKSTLDEVLELQLESLDLMPAQDSRRGCTFDSLGCSFRSRYESLGKMEDLDTAIGYHHDALSFFNDHQPDRAIALANMGVALRRRYQDAGDENDLKMGIHRLREARTCLPDNHRNTLSILTELAVTLLAGKAPSGPPPANYPEEAFDLLADAAYHKAASSLEQLKATRQWISSAIRHRHHSTSHAYSRALALLHKCLATCPDVVTQQEFLGAEGKSLACDAAASAIEERKAEMALEKLEHGRTILWSKLQGYRESLYALRDADSSLCMQFEDVSAKLEHITTLIESDPKASSLEQGEIHEDHNIARDTRMRDHRLLSEEWDDVVDKIRKLRGFEDFLKAVPYSTLQQVAVKSVIVVINISQYRSDALILQGSNPPVIVPLPSASLDSLHGCSAQLFSAIGSDDPDRSKQITPVLRALWYHVMLPIHQELALLNVPRMAHIWLCPTSVLCGLPLHAAGEYVRGAINLPDLYVCSYTPTLSALIRARSGLIQPPCSPRLLAVCQPSDDLREAEAELRCVEALGSFVTTLVGAEATPESVLRHLQRHQWTHFTCHGHRDKEPFKSFLQLYGRHLTVHEITTARLPNAEFAFLSACHTAAADTNGAPDEVIHITSALQFAGFRSVVGTLWQAPDHIGPELATEFYKYMFRSDGAADFRDAAKALSLAMQAIRLKGVPLDCWIQYVHIGA